MDVMLCVSRETFLLGQYTLWVGQEPPFLPIHQCLSYYYMGDPQAGGGGGILTLVLGTHCKTDSWSCGCRLEKRGLSQTQDLSEGGLSEGHFLLGL